MSRRSGQRTVEDAVPRGGQPLLPAQSTTVERHWTSSPDRPGGRKARRPFRYHAYLPGAIAELDPSLEASLMELLGAAEQACRRLNADPPALLSLEALARQLLRAEAVASSRIEGLVVSHRRLARAFLAPGERDTASEVVANVQATERAIELASGPETLTRELLVESHRVLLAGTRADALAGVVRQGQNWIGGRQPNPSDAEFIPPPPEYVEPALDDLVAFLNRTDLPAVLQAAIAHAQFETIHPFLDGNGRVGRALIHVVLRRRGVTPLYVPPVSLVLAGRADDYVSGLTAYREGAEASWYELFANAVETSAERASTFADRITQLQKRWYEQAERPRPQSGAKKLIDVLPAHPVVDLGTVQRAIGTSSRETARQAIYRLLDAGVLREVKTGRKRNRLWETTGLFDLLDTFERSLAPAGRAPRPSH